MCSYSSAAALQNADAVTNTRPNLPDNSSVAALQNTEVVPNASLFSELDTKISKAVQKNSVLKKQKVKGASLMYSKDLRKTLRESKLTADSEVAKRYLCARASQPVGTKRQSPSSFDQPVRGVPVPPPRKKRKDGDCTLFSFTPGVIVPAPLLLRGSPGCPDLYHMIWVLDWVLKCSSLTRRMISSPI